LHLKVTTLLLAEIRWLFEMATRACSGRDKTIRPQRSGKRAFGIDEPLIRSQRGQSNGKGLRISQMSQLALEAECPGSMGCSEPLQEQSPEQFGENPHRQEEAGPAVDPSGSVRRDPAAGDDHMYMRMVRHGTSSGVQHRGDGDLCAKVLRVGGNREHRLGGRFEEQAINDLLVLVGHLADRRRQREDHMIIGHR